MSGGKWTPPERLTENGRGILRIEGKGGVGMVNKAGPPWDADPLLAAEIVRRYNSHAALVAFVEKWREIIGPSMTPGGKRQKALARHLEPWALEFTEEADAALRAARGEA